MTGALRRACCVALGLTLMGSLTAGLALADLEAAAGKALFDRIWAPAPASTSATDGLGPLFTARSCVACHENGGRGKPLINADGRLSGGGLVVRLADGDGRSDPVYGHQIQTHAVQDVPPEAAVRILWQEHTERLGDGTEVTLRRPKAELENLAYGPLAPGTRAMLRLAPGLEPAGRIERFSRSAREAGEAQPLFGWKASEPALASQTALAFSRDLGLSTALYPDAAGDCTAAQAKCLSAPMGAAPGQVELGEEIMSALISYVETLAGRASVTAAASGDEDAFRMAGCAACHIPALARRDGTAEPLFSDLRLHDMGDGLADPAPSDGRKASEWRTAPLLGVGRALSGGRPLLHDGRARTVAEAILWHGGDAAAARDRYKSLPASERIRLEAFVASR